MITLASDKFWKRTDDWFQYAPCFGIPDFTLPPARDDAGPVADTGRVTSMCDSCTVRPECARAAYLESWNAVWVCGTWIPGHDTDKRRAQSLRTNLFEQIPSELNRRGDDV